MNEDDLYDAAEREMDLYRDEITRLRGAHEAEIASLTDQRNRVSDTADQLREQLAASDRIVRDILESLCRRDGLSLESTIEPGEPARNYALAERLGIGHVFGLNDAPAPELAAAMAGLVADWRKTADSLKGRHGPGDARERSTLEVVIAQVEAISKRAGLPS